MPRLRKREQLRMAARFPEIFDISDNRLLAIIDALTERERRHDARFRVLIPARRKSQEGGLQRKHREFTGQISRVGGAFDPTSRTILVEVRLANPDGILLPGMYANVKLSPAGAAQSGA